MAESRTWHEANDQDRMAKRREIDRLRDRIRDLEADNLAKHHAISKRDDRIRVLEAALDDAGDTVVALAKAEAERDAAIDEAEGHRKARCCASCGKTICPPMQCGPCIERAEDTGHPGWQSAVAKMRAERDATIEEAVMLLADRWDTRKTRAMLRDRIAARLEAKT